MTSPSSSSIRRANSPACERARVMTIRLPKRRCRDFRLSALDCLSKAPLIALWLCSLFDSRLVASRLCRRRSVAENSTRALLQQTLRQVVTQLNRVCTRPGDFITINRAPLGVRHNTDQVKGVAGYAPPGSNGHGHPAPRVVRNDLSADTSGKVSTSCKKDICSPMGSLARHSNPKAPCAAAFK